MKSLLFLLPVAMAAAPVSYPLPSQPLRKLYATSDLVAVVTAGPTRRLPHPSGKDKMIGEVTLAIVKAIKGTPAAEGVRVLYRPSLACPAPDDYPEGSRILVFLNWNADRKHYHAPALSYATKVLNDEDLKVYEARMSDLSKLDPKSLQAAPDAAVREWLVRCAEHPATRWEALTESRESPWEVHRLVAGDFPKPVRLEEFTKEQRERLVKTLLESTVVEAPEVELAAILSPVADPRIDRLVADRFDKAMTAKNYFFAERVIAVLAGRLQNAEAKRLLGLLAMAPDDDEKSRVKLLIKIKAAMAGELK